MIEWVLKRLFLANPVTCHLSLTYCHRISQYSQRNKHVFAFSSYTCLTLTGLVGWLKFQL